MSLDLDALEAAVLEGEKKNFFVAPVVRELIAELREAGAAPPEDPDSPAAHSARTAQDALALLTAALAARRVPATAPGEGA